MNNNEIESMVDYANRLFPDAVAIAKGKDKAARYGWTTTGDETAWVNKTMIDVDSLLINHSYQREKLSTIHVGNITAEFDYRLFLPVIVSEKTMCVIDGANRTVAAIRLGIRRIPVSFVSLDSVQAEAEYFLKFNNGILRVKAFDKFRSGVVANNETALAVQNMATRNGVKLVPSAHVKGECKFVSELVKSAKLSTVNCERALIATSQLAIDEPLSCGVFKGVFWLIQRGLTIELHISKLLEQGGYSAIISRSRKARALSGVISQPTQYAMAILEIINIGLRKKITVDA